MDPQVSVVCACRNEARDIDAFLTSLLGQTANGISWEVIIADGMSEDGTRGLLRYYVQKHSHLRMIDNPGRIVATGLNAAIRQARGDIIIRMDAHTEYAADYIQQCVEVLNETGADNVGGVPRVRRDDFRMRLFGAAYHSAFACGGARSHDAEYEGYVDSVFYGCWRKTTLEHLGMFDERFVRNQDDELNLRLIRAGGKIWQSSKIVSWYRPRRTVKSLFSQYFQYGYWKVAVIRKHRMPAHWRHLVPGAFTAAHALFIAAIVATAALQSYNLTAMLLMAWLALLSLYAIVSITAAVSEARRAGWAIGILLPSLFAVYHISYGMGFLAGLAAVQFGRSGKV
jgi:glycosyltransferase involved in cell wall biosynthesis